MTYEDFKNFTRRTDFNEILREEAVNTAKNLKYDGCQRGLASMVYTFFDKKNAGEIMQNKQLAEELHKPIIRKFEKRKVQSSFIDDLWDADLANMQLFSKFYEGVCLLLCY